MHFFRTKRRRRDSDAWQPVTRRPADRGTSAGGGYSTVGDLVRFADALRSHKLLDAEHTKLLTTGKVDVPIPGHRYAYGLVDANERGAHWVGHGGGSPGMNGNLRIFLDSGYTIAVLGNLDPPSADRISKFISDRLPLSPDAER